MASGILESDDCVKTFDVEALDSTVPVEVLCVDSPSSLWIRPTELKRVHDELTLTMMARYIDEGKGRPFTRDNFTNGAFCAVRRNMTVLRGRIIHADDGGCIEVWLIDFGYSDFFSSSDIYHLDNEFKRVPVTAILCGLADVQPSSVEWCDSSQRYISNASFGKIGMATVCTRVVENNTLWIKLSFDGIDIGDELVWEGDALPHRQRLRLHAFR